MLISPDIYSFSKCVHLSWSCSSIRYSLRLGIITLVACLFYFSTAIVASLLPLLLLYCLFFFFAAFVSFLPLPLLLCALFPNLLLCLIVGSSSAPLCSFAINENISNTPHTHLRSRSPRTELAGAFLPRPTQNLEQNIHKHKHLSIYSSIFLFTRLLHIYIFSNAHIPWSQTMVWDSWFYLLPITIVKGLWPTLEPLNICI